jgi:uncharacterized protein (TIGR01244 family)
MSDLLAVHALSSDVCVAGQLSPQVMTEVAQAGFKSVVNNRPDGEGGAEQPTSAAIETAAVAAGLRYVHLPVQPAVQTLQEAAQFAQLLAELPKPILAFCRSGGRSTKLYLAAVASD